MLITATALVCSLPGTTLAQDDESQMLRAANSGASSNSDVNVALDGINRVLEKEMDVLEKEEEGGINDMRFKTIDELDCSDLKEAITGILGAAVDFEQQRIAYEAGSFVTNRQILIKAFVAEGAVRAAAGVQTSGP